MFTLNPFLAFFPYKYESNVRTEPDRSVVK